MLAGPVHDAGWNSFFAKLWYKAASAGRELVKVDPRGTSQTCVCGAAVPKTLAERWHECPVCGLSAPRNVVSAQVILQRARIGRSRQNVEDVVSCVLREAVAFQISEELCQVENWIFSTGLTRELTPPPQFSHALLTTQFSLLPAAVSCVWPRLRGRRFRCTLLAPSSSER